MKLRFALHIFFLFCCFCNAKADQIQYQPVFQHPLSKVDGLVSNEVNCLLQDSKGFMWYGTTNGLCRYDGHGFKVYKSNYLKPLFFTDNMIHCLAEDQNSRLWIGTERGINMIDLETEKVTQFNDALKNVAINSMVVSSENILYLGTSEGLFYYDKSLNSFEKINIEKLNETNNASYIKSLFIDSKNYLWIGGWETNFIVYNLNTNLVVDYPYLKDKEKLIVNCFFEDSNSNIWLSTWGKYGVWRIENPHKPSQSELTNFRVQKSKKSTFYPVVYGINESKKTGDIVLATSDGIQTIRQAYKYNGDVDVDKNISDKISSDEIFAMTIDRTGLIWYSIHGMGVNALSTGQTQFEQYNLSSMIDKDNWLSSITGVYEDHTGMLWIGIKSFVLGLFDRHAHNFTLYNNHPILNKITSEANCIYSFHRPSLLDELWLGTRYDGVYVVKYKDGKIASVERMHIENIESKNLAIRFMVEDPKTNDIWLATNRGLVKAEFVQSENKYVYRYFNIADKRVNDKPISTLLFDDDGSLWVGTNNSGVFKLSFKENKIYSEQYSYQNEKMNNNDILCLYKDHKNRLWVGSKGGGLCLFDKQSNKFNIIGNMPLMPDDAVYGINEDNWGNLWLATGNGLVCYNEDLPYNERIKIFSSHEGLKINAFNTNASFKNNKNELFFGGKNGLVAFIPQQRDNQSFTPRPVITNISIANQPIDQLSDEERETISLKQIAYTDKINLSYQQKNILIEFSSLLYENNTAVKYAYKLEEVDEDWIYVDSKKRFASYNNLSSGEYTFKVKSTNKDGIWCDSPTVLKIKIAPAPWNTIYAYIGYILLGSMILFIISRAARNQFRLRRMLTIEQIEREKTEEVHQAKLKFFTNISHEFFTPITIIKCVIDRLMSKNTADSAVLYTMKVNTDRLIRLLDQIIEFRKVETGNVRLKLSEIELVSFIKELCDVHFAPFAIQKDISFEFICEHDTINGFVDCDKLDKIIYNLLSNAIKYNKEGGYVHVKVDEVNVNGFRELLIVVEDSGHGMNDEVKQNIFKRFYEGNFRDFKVKSIGIGLSLTHDLVKLHSGEISVESQENIGSTFSVSLPIDRDAYPYIETPIMSETTNYYLSEENTIEGESDNNKLNLLIVEDNLELQNLIVEALNKDFFVFKAEDGKAALNILEKNRIDILVADYLMPVMDGVELTKEMKNNVQFSHIPVIMLSARHNIEHKIEGYDAGADSYITKPFEMAVLIANINSLIRNRRLQAESFSSKMGVVDVGDFAHNDTDKEFLENVIKTIEESIFEKEFATNDLYSKFHMSQSTFYRKLQALIGVSPNELIKKVKINMACRMMDKGNTTVSDVAYDLGFSDPKYFSSIFKKEMGVTPSEYMKVQ